MNTTFPILSSLDSIIESEQLEKQNRIGKSSTADIYQGTWLGAPVAIKKYVMKSLPEHMESHLKPLCTLKHPNLINNFGFCVVPGKFSMVLELMPPDSNLTAYLALNVLTDSQIKNMASQLASGMSYLHQKKIAHLHLKGNNVFVTENFIVKISEFGVRNLKTAIAGQYGSDETIKWRAPESFEGNFQSEDIEKHLSADVYCYGLLLWHICSKSIPFALESEADVLRLKRANIREIIPANCPSIYYEIITNCWLDAEKRPLMSNIVHYLAQK